LLGSSAVGVAALGTYGVTEAYGFQISRHTFKLPQLEKPLKLAHLTDLHFGTWIDENTVRRWVEATQRERPDVIVVTGDLVHRLPSQDGLERLAHALEGLNAPLGVWAVLGNHDYWGRKSITTRDLVDRLERAGLRFLVNDGATLRPDLHLAGIDDLWEGQPNLTRTLRDAPTRGATILLSHNPDVLVRVPKTVGLTLSGHTHGGQIRIPGLPTLFNVSHYGERFQQGFVQSDTGAHGFVSRGIGFGGVPIRTFCPAELVVLNLSPA
jgi:uncharacterized protein